MTFLEILSDIKNKGTKDPNKNDLIDFIDCFEKNINLNIKYKYIEKIDAVLQNIKKDTQQVEIIQKKFNSFKTRDELFDFLTELIICYEHLLENPKFIKEENNKETPDLKTDNLFLEIKRIRNSDDQNKLVENLILKSKNSGNLNMISGELDMNNQRQEIDSLFKKVREKIDKAIKQIGDNHGIIYLIYSVDLLGLKSQEERKDLLIKYIYDYFRIKNKINIELRVTDLNNLFFK